NGFVSEFLIYLAAFGSLAGAEGQVMPPIPGLVAIGALALIGGLATACFTKAFGIVFLGEPRSADAALAKEAGPAMRLPMVLLATACVGVGLFPVAAVFALTPALLLVARQPKAAVTAVLAGAADPLRMIAIGAALLLVIVAFLTILRRRLLAGRSVEETGTWDCGYARPTARMQYTASSFAQPLTELFCLVLRTRTRLVPPKGLFPRRAALETDTPDAFSELLFRPAFAGIERALDRLRVLQQGRIQVYVLYIVLTLIALMVWKLG
ncbi:MAG: hydrogenase, partial [candidate division NC10 bacterium]